MKKGLGVLVLLITAYQAISRAIFTIPPIRSEMPGIRFEQDPYRQEGDTQIFRSTNGEYQIRITDEMLSSANLWEVRGELTDRSGAVLSQASMQGKGKYPIISVRIASDRNIILNTST